VTRKRPFKGLLEIELNHGAEIGGLSSTIALDNSPDDKTFFDFKVDASNFLNLIDAMKVTSSSAFSFSGPWRNLHSFSIFSILP
jgi:hypothetical protein